MPNLPKHRLPHTTDNGTRQFITASCYSSIPYLGIVEEAKAYFFNKMNKYAKELSIKLKAWVILDNHYHLLTYIKFGETLPIFIRKLHGATGNFIRKNEPDFVTAYGQVVERPVTSWDRRQWKRYEDRIAVIEDLLAEARDKSRYSGAERVAQSCRVPCSDRVARSSGTAVNARPSKRPNNKTAIKIRLKKEGIELKTTHLSADALSQLLINRAPVWYQYINTIIAKEPDYWSRFNYIHQNVVKHGYMENPFKYKWSSINSYDKDYVLEVAEKYPVRDYGGVWEP